VLAPRLAHALLALAVVAPLAGAGCRERATPQTREPAVRGAAAAQAPLVIDEIMADPRAVPDERGEWFELYNPGDGAATLRGWTIASGNDAPHPIAGDVVVPARGYAVLARSAAREANGGVTVAYAYGPALSLGNDADWLVLRDASGATVDSVAWRSAPSGAARGVRDPSAASADVNGAAWTTQSSRYGAGDRGTPGAPNDGPAPAVAGRPTAADDSARLAATGRDAGGDVGGDVGGSPALDSAGGGRQLTVRVLDVGQGDAVYVTNGRSKAFIDGGADPDRLGRHLDALGLNGGTVDVVVISHAHSDHYNGLQALFESRRKIRVRYVFENKDLSPNSTLADLRDSVLARVRRGELVYRDTDDPCANGRPICTVTMSGGAKLHVMRPRPARGDVSPNNRSTPVKLVAPDSAAFTMWMAGDAEHEAIAWFDTTDYDVTPGMRSSVLKADHHGSCNGVTARYLALVRPALAVISLGADNPYGHVHEQAKAAYRRAGVPWYRTDRNGTIVIRSPAPRAAATPGSAAGASGYAVTVERGGRNASGTTDRRSTQEGCAGM
jgi:competence protein ComEC